jgi:hypothetical protein
MVKENIIALILAPIFVGCGLIFVSLVAFILTGEYTFVLMKKLLSILKVYLIGGNSTM